MNAKELLNTLVLAIVKESGSDIHLMADSVPVVRIHGSLIKIQRLSVLSSEDVQNVLKEMIDEVKFVELHETKQVDFAYTHIGQYRLRGNAFFENGRMALTLRLIAKIKSIKDLGLPDILLEFAHKKQGFFLVAGPVGQGKSSTLASMIDDINEKDSKMIITIEDPIEYLHQSKNSVVLQRELGLDVNDFATGLISALRQDVDVILIGEMRDIETMRAAVTAAETGHLVLSTLHTNSASQTIDRIIDSFPAMQQDQIRAQLASSLLGVFSQRLLPRVGGGLIPIYELLIANSAVQNLIREKRVYEIDSVIETGGDKGMISFDRCLAEHVRSGDVPLDAAMRYAKNVKILEQML